MATHVKVMDLNKIDAIQNADNIIIVDDSDLDINNNTKRADGTQLKTFINAYTKPEMDVLLNSHIIDDTKHKTSEEQIKISNLPVNTINELASKSSQTSLTNHIADDNKHKTTIEQTKIDNLPLDTNTQLSNKLELSNLIDIESRLDGLEESKADKIDIYDFILQIQTLEKRVALLEAGGTSWEITYTFPYNYAIFSYGTNGRILKTDWTGWNANYANVINEDLYENSLYPTEDDLPVILYAKYSINSDWMYVPFDNFPQLSGGNKLTGWGVADNLNAIYIIGTNATGEDISLKLVKKR